MELNLNQKVIDNIGIGLTKYNHIIAAIQNTDVSSDIEFQKRYNGFYRMRQRPAEYYSTYFNFMEKQKNRDVTFEETLRYLHASLGRIEASFSSKLVVTINPNKPVWDEFVLQNLGIKKPTTYSKNRIEKTIDKFFPEFDRVFWAKVKALELDIQPEVLEKKWKDKAELSAKDGKILHEQIEKYFLNNENFTSKEFGFFKDFMIDNPQISPFRTEWRIFDEEYLVAGTIDLVSKNRNEYEIYDWKRSHRIIDDDKKPKIKGHVGKHGIGELFHIADTQYNRYCLQQSMYKFILEKTMVSL